MWTFSSLMDFPQSALFLFAFLSSL
jgi:hypothetical protein